MEKQEVGSHIKLAVFASSDILSVINIENYEGLEENIESTGIDKNGIPVNKQVKPQYPFVGKVIGYVDLTRVYRVGVFLNSTRNAKNESIVGPKAFGAEAIAVMMQRNGLPLGNPPSWLDDKLDSLVESGTVYIFKESSTFNMDTATYGKAGYTDKWIISSKHPTQSVDKWNEFLKKLHSDWRIKSSAVTKLLASKAIAALLK